ncbi:unnamed protein product [Amoebophrya sp. A25]|nr:unnamed protein product [Amoebophrya sp. A25]|eukprot:GSA25T00013376001.1
MIIARWHIFSAIKNQHRNSGNRQPHFDSPRKWRHLVAVGFLFWEDVGPVTKFGQQLRNFYIRGAGMEKDNYDYAPFFMRTFLQAPGVTTTKDPGVKDILVVVDMQQDYCKYVETPEKKSKYCPKQSRTFSLSPRKLWSVPEVDDTADAIDNKYVALPMGTWDGIVFTRDSLKCPDGQDECSLERGKDKIIPRLLESAIARHGQENVLEFTKTTDDWMTEKEACDREVDSGCWPIEDQFDVEHAENEVGHPLEWHMRERFNLSEDPAKTRLTVVGTQINRCILKGSLHAKEKGYIVHVGTDAAFSSDEAFHFDGKAPYAPPPSKEFMQEHPLSD